MTSVLPKLRADLEIRHQATDNGTVMVIKDPLSREFFRLQEAERFIVQQLNGATPLEEIQSRVEEKFGASLAPEALAGFIKALDRKDLLAREDGKRKSRPKQRSQLNGNLLYLQFKLFDPDRLFNRLVGKVQFCFTRPFLIFSSAVIIAAVVVAGFNATEMAGDLPRLFQWSALPLILAAVFFVITLHEFGHGLTCKHFGGEVHELGFMLLYFQPAMYCNVSDAWLFPERSKRLWVGFAGPYFELFLWALATLFWRVTDPSTWINYLALIVLTTSGLKTLFNFNPLIKLDGYYLLSDWLEMPNLRKKSFRYAGQRIKQFIGITSEDAWDLPRRERRICLTYGLAASLFSFCFLAYATMMVGGFLIERHQSLAFVLFTGLVGTRLRQKVRKMFAASATAAKSARKMFVLSKRRVLNFAGLGAGVVFLFWGEMELRIAGPFNVLPIHNADARARVDGIIEEITVDEGDLVQEGDLIALLSDREFRAELQKTEAELEQTQAKLNLLKAGTRAEEIELARTTVAKAEDRLKFVKSRLERDKSLFEQKLLSRNDYETTAEQAASAEKEAEEAKKKLDLLLAGSRPEEIDATQAGISRLDAQRRYLEEQIELVRVISPAAGIITTPSRQLKEMNRQLVKQGDLIAKVHELKTIVVEIAVPEKEVADVQVGFPVAIKARAYPDLTFHGKVTSIATTALGSSGSPAKSAPSPPPLGAADGKAVLVTTEIDNPSLLLKPEMTGQAKIYCGSRRPFELVIRRIARTVKVEFWSWW